MASIRGYTLCLAISKIYFAISYARDHRIRIGWARAQASEQKRIKKIHNSFAHWTRVAHPMFVLWDAVGDYHTFFTNKFSFISNLSSRESCVAQNPCFSLFLWRAWIIHWTVNTWQIWIIFVFAYGLRLPNLPWNLAQRLLLGLLLTRHLITLSTSHAETHLHEIKRNTVECAWRINRSHLVREQHKSSASMLLLFDYWIFNYIHHESNVNR